MSSQRIDEAMAKVDAAGIIPEGKWGQVSEL